MLGLRSIVVPALLFASIVLNAMDPNPVRATKPGHSQSIADPLPTPVAKPPFSTYRNISIGMKTDEARKILGEPRDKSETEDFYLFSEDEIAQVFYDANHTVSAMSITYYNNLTKAPTSKDVFGEDVPAKPDGSIFRSVRYPKAGFSVSYGRTAGDKPSISITLQKI